MSPGEIRFAADGMLQSLGTWLRLLGYDCLTDAQQRGRQLLEQAVVEDRVFLTRNAHLSDNLPQALLQRAAICPIVAENLPGQLREVIGRFALNTEQYVFSLCVECNVALHMVDRTIARPAVPADVAEREREFWQCPACGKTFWRGSHVHNSLAHLEQWLAGITPR